MHCFRRAHPCFGACWSGTGNTDAVMRAAGPAVTANATTTPLTASCFASLTITLGAVATAASTVPEVLPACSSSCAQYGKTMRDANHWVPNRAGAGRQGSFAEDRFGGKAAGGAQTCSAGLGCTTSVVPTDSVRNDNALRGQPARERIQTLLMVSSILMQCLKNALLRRHHGCGFKP